MALTISALSRAIPTLAILYFPNSMFHGRDLVAIKPASMHCLLEQLTLSLRLRDVDDAHPIFDRDGRSEWLRHFLEVFKYELGLFRRWRHGDSHF
jgi:hypothetical protein